jgi:hypothetical protein
MSGSNRAASIASTTHNQLRKVRFSPGMLRASSIGRVLPAAVKETEALQQRDDGEPVDQGAKAEIGEMVPALENRYEGRQQPRHDRQGEEGEEQPQHRID